MGALHDLNGQKFGRLTVQARARNSRNGKTAWLCLCACGKEPIVLGNCLCNGRTKSCGCLRREVSRTNQTVHGLRGTPLYGAWVRMKTRCYNPKCREYPRYGGAGITVCDRWRHSYTSFLADMGERPPSTSIDRIDNEGGYEPGNCRWASSIVQANNRRNNRILEFRGDAKTIATWGRETGIKAQTIHMRITRGWPVERALTELVRGWAPGRPKPKP